MNAKFLRGTKALVVILGVHGGGVANAGWLLRRGAKVAVTDMRSRKELAHSLAQFSRDERRRIRFVLGGQREEDFRNSDLILLGPGVQKRNPWRKLAFDLGKRVENDASLFLRYARRPVIAVTGTRGKTTTTDWVTQLLAKRYSGVRASGNTPENALLREIDRRMPDGTPHVAEFSSWQLELAPIAQRSPQIAIITNLYRDHLNTYDGMEDYADAKANIFAYQREGDTLILNHGNPWTKYFLKKNPRSRIRYFSLRTLPRGKDGIFVRAGNVFLREGKTERRIVRVGRFLERFGAHNLENLLAAMLAVLAFDPRRRFSERDILSLRAPRMRQEVISDSRRLRVVNDSAATSPDGTIAALARFSRDSQIILIAGGTDKELEFSALARRIYRDVPPERLILLSGTATDALAKELKRLGYAVTAPRETLEECVSDALSLADKSKTKTTILFSPGAASFGKFLHEFDRGEQFTRLVRSRIGGREGKRSS